MTKNSIKNMLDIIKIIFLIISIVILNKFENIVICLIPIILVIIVTIIERIIWRCPTCGKYLPANSWVDKVICCPYCNKHID